MPFQPGSWVLNFTPLESGRFSNGVYSPSPECPIAEAQGGMARGDRDVARRAKSGGFGAVPRGFTMDAPCGSSGSFTLTYSGIGGGTERETNERIKRQNTLYGSVNRKRFI